MKTFELNLNSHKPQIVVSILLKAIQQFEDTPINRIVAINLATTLWAVRGQPVEVSCWKSGYGKTIFKRTHGHCIG